MYAEIEKWLQTSKANEEICYYKGYLAKDRFRNIDLRDMANLMLRSAYNKTVVLYQKRVEYGNALHDPIFKYMARKI